MPSDFRREVFKLCKYLQKDETAKRIGTMIHDMSAVVESPKNRGAITNSKNDFAYIAKHNNTEFHGFLFLDDNIDKIELPKLFSPEHLLREERILLECGHKTLTRFVELCLSDIEHVSKRVAESMNPYFLYKDVKISSEAKSLISDEDLQAAVLAFKSGAVYSALIASKFTTMFDKFDDTATRALIGTLERDIKKSLGEDVDKDLRAFSLRLGSGLSNTTDVLLAFSILIFALKESLRLSCRMLYRAICGVDLFVLNNDNIINIENRVSTPVCELYKVFSQDISIDYSGSEIGSILLIDCDLPNEAHIHEFGMVIAETINFASEFGSTAKYSFITTNEEMIYLHLLIKAILRAGLPVVSEQPPI